MQYNDKVEDIKDYIVYSLSFIVFIYAIITITVPSCGNIFCGNKKALVGTWVRDMSVPGTPLSGVSEVWRFGNDGSFTNSWECEKGHYNSMDYPKIMASGKYKVFGNKITLKYSGVKEEWSYSLSHSNKELRIGKDASGYKLFQRSH